MVPPTLHFTGRRYALCEDEVIIVQYLDSIFFEDPHELAFKICTIALRYSKSVYMPLTLQGDDPVLSIWLELAQFMDSNHPHLVQSVLGDPNFPKSMIFTMPLDLLQWNQQRFQHLLKRGKGNLNTLEYAAALGLAGTIRLERETKAPDEHEFHRAMEFLIACTRWDVIHELWACGEYDINAYCYSIDRTAICELLSDSYHLYESRTLRRRLRPAFLQHPSTSLRCPRHDGLLGCIISASPSEAAFADIAIILERLYRDSKDVSSHPGRISVYLPPSRTRSRPPDILDITAVFLQRADIDLDAYITRMVPPEILLALLMLRWNSKWDRDIEMISIEEVLRPYARRPVDIPDASTSNHVPDADALADNVVPDIAPAVEAMDTCATAEPGSADNAPARVPASEVLDDRVVPDTVREAGAVDMYRMTVVHLVVAVTLSLFIYLCYLLQSHSYR